MDEATGSTDNPDDKQFSELSWASEEQTRIMESFGQVSDKLQFSLELLENHQRSKPLEKRPLISQLNMIALIFSDFARNQEYFSCLTEHDQDILLKTNCQLYIQYILARYFNATSGIEQISWICQGNLPTDNVAELSRISLDEYNCSTNLFISSESADHYAQLSENVARCYPLERGCNGLVANMLLFHAEAAQSLDEKSKISGLFDKAAGLLKLRLESRPEESLESDTTSSFAPLIRALTKMRSIFDKCKS